MNALSRYVQVMTQMRFTRSEKKQEKLQGLADRYLSQYLMLCNYVEKYSLQHNMDKTVEDAIEEYRSRGDEEDEIAQERQNILEDVEKVRDNEKRKRVELQNHEERMMLEEKKEEIVHLAEAEEEENEAEKAVVPDPNRIDPEDQQKELIPGTDIPKPRDREVHETDAEYEAFLKDYYEKAYGTEKDVSSIIPEVPKEEMIPGTEIPKPRDREAHETDAEYEAFLKDYYGQAFEPASTALSTIPANTQLVPVSPQSTPQLSPEKEHQDELSLMMVELDQMPRRAPVMQPNGELDSMLVDDTMGPSGQVISPAVMSK